MEVTETLVRNLIATINPGLARFCNKENPQDKDLRAAIVAALGAEAYWLNSLISPAVAAFDLCDANWSTDQARAKGLMRLAVAQLGSYGALDQSGFVHNVVNIATIHMLPKALRQVAGVLVSPSLRHELEYAADNCECLPELDAAIAAAYATTKVMEQYKVIPMDQEGGIISYVIAHAVRSVFGAAMALERAARVSGELKHLDKKSELIIEHGYFATSNERHAAKKSADVLYAIEAVASTGKYAAMAMQSATAASIGDECCTSLEAAEAADRFLGEYAERVVLLLMGRRTSGTEHLHLIRKVEKGA